MGYYVEVDVLKASNYGVPQNRKGYSLFVVKKRKLAYLLLERAPHT